MKINTKKISNVLSHFSKKKSSKSPYKYYTNIKLETTTITTKTIPRQIMITNNTQPSQETMYMNNSNTEKIKVYINKNVNKKPSKENISFIPKKNIQHPKLKNVSSNPNIRINHKAMNKNYTKRNSNPNLFMKKRTTDVFKKTPLITNSMDYNYIKNEYFSKTEKNFKKKTQSSENLHTDKKINNNSPKSIQISSPQMLKNDEIIINFKKHHQISENNTIKRGDKKMTLTDINNEITKELNNKVIHNVKKTKSQTKIVTTIKNDKTIKNENESTNKKQSYNLDRKNKSKTIFSNLNSKNDNNDNIPFDTQSNKTIKKKNTDSNLNDTKNNNENTIQTEKRKYNMNTFNAVKHTKNKNQNTKENIIKPKDFKEQFNNNDKEKNRKNLENKKLNSININYSNNNIKKNVNKDIQNKNLNTVNNNTNNNRKDYIKNKRYGKNDEKNYNKNMIYNVNYDKNKNINNTNMYYNNSFNKISINNDPKSKTAKLFFKGMKSIDSSNSTIKNNKLNISSSKSNTINSINSINISKVIIKYDELLTLESKLNDIINILSKKENIYDMGASNECVEFMSFYFRCSLNGIFKCFFIEKNRIIIHSWNNLILFSIIITYNLSITPNMLEQLLNDLRYVFSLIIVNFYLLIKKIQIYYGKEFPRVIKEKFTKNLFKYKINNTNNENDIIIKINKNCCNITERLKIILNYYQRNKNPYYIQFNKIFSNISTIPEKALNNYFYNYIYINPFYIQKLEHSRTSMSSGRKKRTYYLDNIQNYNPSKKGYFSENEDEFKSEDERELLSVISENSAYYQGKITAFNINENNNDKNDDNENNYNNVINDQNDKIAKAINYYIEKKIEAPFIKTPCTKKYTLVLDLDETLIHLQPQIDYKNRYNFLENNSLDAQNLNKKDSHKYLLLFRVGLFSFLTILKPFYELISFTSASREYADPIIKEIEKNKKYFDYCFYREHCVVYGNNFVKDISRIGRDIKKMIIVDNNENNFLLNKENGIKISPFYGDNVCRNYEMDIRLGNNKSDMKNCDNALIDLKKILILIYKNKYEDLRVALKDFKGEIYSKVTANRINNKI